MSKVLQKVNCPQDVKDLGMDELSPLAADIRALITETVSQTGGHLAANLGVVELTIALLRVFSPPRDKIVWDVSHQAYAYKILTERRDSFHTLRQFGGISGFLKRSESEYDAFGAGHSGTALSAALGMAVARDRDQRDEHVVAVVGDAAAGCGVSFEALNNLASSTKRLIVVLNDNEMSISENVGAFSSYMGRLLTTPRYNRWKHTVESAASRLGMGFFRSIYYRVEEAIKSLFLRSIFFEELGLRYVGPIDGHNFSALLDAIAIARDSEKPILLHVSTQKGRGYAPAEAHPEDWHGTSGFDPATGKATSRSTAVTYSDVFGKTLVRLAETNPRLIAITAAMRKGTGLADFAARFPDRFFDVGISEEHGVVFAAGLATQGHVPVFAVYSTFSQRIVDYIIHDVCLQKLPVVLCLDRAGVVGDDGATHHGVFDIALLRPIPNLVIMQPASEPELADMLHTAIGLGKPVVIRYPRGGGPGLPLREDFQPVEIGKAEVVRPGKDAQIWALGDMIPVALKAADLLAARGITAGVVNARFVKPVDHQLLRAHAAEARAVAVIENGVRAGGFGSVVAETLASYGFRGETLRFGWPDDFVPQGPPEILMREAGLTAEIVAEGVCDVLKRVP